MLFVEARFFLFFAVVLAVAWGLRGNRSRKVWLLACSYVFYAGFFVGPPGEFARLALRGAWGKLPPGWWFPFVLAASTCMDYAVGLGIARSVTPRGRRSWLLGSLVANLGVLVLFKYFNFFVGTAQAFLAWLGLPASTWTLAIILPYGVSFYTFQSMSYSIEVYRGKIPPERDFLDLAFFISFFPQLVAGPIVRAAVFLPQVKTPRRFADVDVRAALLLFLSGFVKKTCVSESVAPLVDRYFAAPWGYDAVSAVTAALLYAVQIYCDFSGYTDMAIAAARLLGYELTRNFAFPYLAANVADFWRRWHISLSSWLRDYLYIPLGGNRGSRAFTHRNLMLTMLLGGLWHGASWNFVAWGGLHGLALAVHREYARFADRAGPAWQRVRAAAGPVLCFAWVCLLWAVFRSAPVVDARTHQTVAGSFTVASTVLGAILTLRSPGSGSLGHAALWAFAGLAAVHLAVARWKPGDAVRRAPAPVFYAFLGASWALALLFVPHHYTPFIYFQF